MNTPKNTHQILYAKNFYQRTGDIISDMRKVCKLDEPNWDFSSPKQILKFMRKQYAIWLENTPEVDKEVGSKVAWDDNPISAEMWSIMSAYACYIPLSSKYIKGLPNYNVLKPQYGAFIGYHERERPFMKGMTIEQMTTKAKEILDRSNLENLDIIADDACNRFDYDKASKLLKEFGEEVSAKELDDELWTGYSELVGNNLDGDGNLPENHYHCFTKHFSIYVCPIYKPNCSFNIDINLIPFRFEYKSNNICTIENILNERVECIKAIIKKYESSKTAAKIAEVCTKLHNEDSWLWDTPKHLVGDEMTIIDAMKDATLLDSKDWGYYHINPENEWKWFEKATDEFSPSISGSGCFFTYIYNDNGHMRMAIAFETMFECGALDGSLWNGCIVSEPKY